MAVDSDTPGDAIATRESRNGPEDGGLPDDDDLDIYSQEGAEPQVNVSAPAAADGPAEPAAAVDDYAKSFDSPIREEEDASFPQGEAEPVVSAPSPDRSSHKQPEPADAAPDQTKSNPASLAGEASSEAWLPSLPGAGPARLPVVQADAAVVATTQPADGARSSQQPKPSQDQPQPASQHVLGHESPEPPNPRCEDSSFAGNDANLALDIQELVNDINTASPSVPATSLPPDSPASDASGQMQMEPDGPPAVANDAPATGTGQRPLPAASSLPADMSRQINQLHPKQGDPNPLPFPANSAPPTGPAALVHQAQAGKKGSNRGGRGAKNGNALPPSGPAATRGAPSGPKAQAGSRHNARNAGPQTYDIFLADERRYTAEAKWEKFPDGSRIFVGNLSQERVSKKEVFGMFHKYGRLAQISLKPAYGFVQYHTAAEAAEAIRHLQGIDVRGRKINLEVSKTQKKSGKERERSPDRNNDRNSKKDGRKGDSYDGRENARDGGRQSDGYRPSYDPHTRRGGDRFGDDHGRGRHGERGRSRSRSPRAFSRSDDYRQRSPTRSHGDSRGYGADGGRSTHAPQGGVLDAQILLLQDVHKDFVQHVQKGFSDRDLRTDVMFVDPRFLEPIVQRQIADGAHAVIKLDLHAQNYNKVAAQIFNRTPGTMHVNFNEYRDIDVNVAAELVVQAKMRNQPPTHQPHPAAYPAPHAAAGYPQSYPQPNYPGYAVNPQAATPFIPGVDPALLQKVLMSLQGQPPQAGVPTPVAYGAPAHAPVPASAAPLHAAHAAMGGPAPQQFDINAILSSLKSSSAHAPAGSVSAPYGVAGYPAGTAPGSVPPPAAHQQGADPSQQVQSIMAQLARFRR